MDEAVHRGEVTRTTDAGAYVKIPRLGGSVTEYGPCEVAASVAPLADGQRVVVARVAPGDFVVLAALS